MKDLKPKVKALRSALGFTQQELAEAVGLKKSSIVSYENNQNISLKSQLKFIDVFELEKDYFDMLDYEEYLNCIADKLAEKRAKLKKLASANSSISITFFHSITDLKNEVNSEKMIIPYNFLKGLGIALQDYICINHLSWLLFLDKKEMNKLDNNLFHLIIEYEPNKIKIGTLFGKEFKFSLEEATNSDGIGSISIYDEIYKDKFKVRIKYSIRQNLIWYEK